MLQAGPAMTPKHATWRQYFDEEKFMLCTGFKALHRTRHSSADDAAAVLGAPRQTPPINGCQQRWLTCRWFIALQCSSIRAQHTASGAAGSAAGNAGGTKTE